MIRRIIQIDKEKCNGCSACATACHEGAITMIEGRWIGRVFACLSHWSHHLCGAGGCCL